MIPGDTNPPTSDLSLFSDATKLLSCILDSQPDLIFVKDLEGRYVYDNAAHWQFLGAPSAADVIGKTVHDFFPKEQAAIYHDDDLAVMRTGQPVINREDLIAHASGRLVWMSTSKTPLRDADGRIIGIIGRERDITIRKQAQEALAQERALLDQLMTSTPDHIYFKDLQSRFIRISAAHLAMFHLKKLEDVAGKTDFDFFTEEHARQALADEQEIIRTGKPIVGFVEKETWPDGHRTWVSTTKVPLRDNEGRIIGTFGISRDVTAHKEAEEQAAQYAQALREKNAQMEADLLMAREVQQTMLVQRFPTFPPAAMTADSALRFTHRYLPCAVVSGDFYVVLPLSDTAAGIFICDVTGKGVRAALITTMIRAVVQEFASVGHNPSQFLASINRGLSAILQDPTLPIFATAFYLVADAAAGEVRFANAGHVLPIHVRRTEGSAEFLRADDWTPGPALGVFGDSVYPTGVRPMAVNDLIMLFTDGMVEAVDADDNEFGQQRLLAAAQQRRRLAAPELFNQLLAEVQQFSAKREFADDVCLLGVELTHRLR
jgi:sigma-B regulation protein RsbU (phosphoserine phosphatase)